MNDNIILYIVSFSTLFINKKRKKNQSLYSNVACCDRRLFLSAYQTNFQQMSHNYVP